MFQNSVNKEKIDFGRSKELSLFSIFQIEKNDVSDIMQCVEQVCWFSDILLRYCWHTFHSQIDSGYTGRVNLIEFAKFYCGSHEGVFILLWKQFQYALDVKADNPVLFKPSYNELIGLLIVFLSLRSTEIAKFMYFLWFFIPYIIPQLNPSKQNRTKYRIHIENLEKVLEHLWATNTKQIHKIPKYKAKLKKTIRDDNIDCMTYNQFRSYNLMCSVAFTQPLNNLQHHLRDVLIGSGTLKM